MRRCATHFELPDLRSFPRLLKKPNAGVCMCVPVCVVLRLFLPSVVFVRASWSVSVHTATVHFLPRLPAADEKWQLLRQSCWAW